ncbi:MAG: hypothetical protein KDA60_21870 [Planctomycetales bacterium]|nr:hypothetical protein [Planctomycetales bacterium]
MNGKEICELCESELASSFHHLIPRTLHSNKWFKKRFTRADMAAGIDVCRGCHRAIHSLIPREKELGRHFHTVESLRNHPLVGRYVRWKRRQSAPGGAF